MFGSLTDASASGGVPLLLFMHFTDTMDHWDRLVTDGLAATREVILFNNAGISSSSGEVPTTIEGMAAETGGPSLSLAVEVLNLGAGCRPSGSQAAIHAELA